MADRLQLRGGTQVHFTSRGQGRNLLCIHGLGGGSYFFSATAEALHEERRIAALDLPGFGLSPPFEGPFRFSRCVEVIEEVISTHLDQPLTLLGHSMGTILALQVAAAGRVSLESLIFVGGLPRPTPEARSRLLERAGQVRREGMEGVGAATMPIVFSERSLRRIPDNVAMYSRLLEAGDPATYASAAEALAEADARQTLERISLPCLAVTGSEDRYAPPAAVQEFVARLPARVSYREMPDCGHMPFFEDPETFHAILGGFLNP